MPWYIWLVSLSPCPVIQCKLAAKDDHAGCVVRSATALLPQLLLPPALPAVVCKQACRVWLALTQLHACTPLCHPALPRCTHPIFPLLPSPCPPQFMGLCQLPPAIVTEYCARGSLYSCLQSARTDPAAAAELTWARRLSMVS